MLNRSTAPVHPAADAEAHDEHGTDMLSTLATYIACERSPKLTAETLFIHRNTLGYRIERIRELTALDLDDPGVRNALAASLSLHSLLC